MIPILLHAHTRPLTKVIYNVEGDLLFSSAKDQVPCVWYAHNGERLGTFNGHEGAVWSMSVAKDSRLLATGSADNTLRIWQVKDGKCVSILTTKTAVRSVAFNNHPSSDDNSTNQNEATNLVAFITDFTMGHKSLIGIYDIGKETIVASVEWPEKASKPTVVTWTPDRALLTGHDNGRLVLWQQIEENDLVTLKQVLENSTAHTETIRDIQWSLDGTYFITASKDTSAKLLDTATLTVRRQYRTERPVNAASISPRRFEVAVAGGQEALQVTTTSSRAGQFEARFFDQLTEGELGRVRGHFGPINTLAYHPDGRGYASGGEDGYVRLHVFDPDYYKMPVSTI